MKYNGSPRFVLVCSLLFSIPAIAQPQLSLASTGQLVQTQSQSGSVVRGRAIYTDGQPIKGARIRIFTAGEDAMRIPAVVANERGEFQITGLAAGKYYLSLEGSGVPAPSGMGMRIPLPLAAIPGPGDYPEITPKHDAKFTVDGSNSIDIEVRIVRGGSISGRVLKSNGGPVAQAAVNLISREGGGPYMSRFSTQTDNEGKFKIENLPPGDYVVSASNVTRQSGADVLARLRGDNQVVTYHPAALRLNDALPVKVDSGRESSGVNVTLVARKNLSISGSVVRGSDGSPLVGATVVLRNKEADITGPLVPSMMQRTAESDAAGKWSFTNVEEGEYQVVALDQVGGGRQPGMMSPRAMQRGVPGGPPQMSRVDPGPRPRFMMAQQEVNLVGVKVENLVLSINGPGAIRGLVETEDGSALPNNLPLFFEFSNPGQRPGRPVPVRVAADGSFLLTDIQAGDTFIIAALPNGARHFIAAAEIDGSDLSSAPVKVVEGAEVGPIRVKLSDKFAHVSGSVVGRESIVVFIPADVNKQKFRSAYTPVRTLGDGSFSVRLPPGEYRIMVRSSVDMPPVLTPEFIQKLNETLVRARFEAGENKPLNLTAQTNP